MSRLHFQFCGVARSGTAGGYATVHILDRQAFAKDMPRTRLQENRNAQKLIQDNIQRMFLTLLDSAGCMSGYQVRTVRDNFFQVCYNCGQSINFTKLSWYDFTSSCLLCMHLKCLGLACRGRFVRGLCFSVRSLRINNGSTRLRMV